MPTINLLSVETVGVDMKTNPLLLGNRKLHAATNLVFEEGVIRTRPGIAYHSLEVSGQFQGGCSYRPQYGLSAGTFSETGDGLALAVSGHVYHVSVEADAPCPAVKLTASATYKGKGAVHLFQAENHLVVQNPDTVTIWWDGEGVPTISPGMVEQEWNDPETPWDELNEPDPVANIPDCDPPPQPWQVEYTILDANTKVAIVNALIRVDRLGVNKFIGGTDANGKYTFSPKERRYLFKVDAAGYFPFENYYTYRRPRNEEERDGCYFVSAADRTIRYVVYLTPFVSGGTPPPPPTPDPDPEPVCDFVIENVWMGTPGDPTLPGEPGYNTGPFYYGEMTVRNTGAVPITGVTPSLEGFAVNPVWSPASATIAAGGSQTFSLTTDSSDFTGFRFYVNTSCVNVNRVWYAPDGINPYT